MILKQAFSLKIRVWNGIFGKNIRILKWIFFLQIDKFLNREFFVLADFEKFFPIIVLRREIFLEFRFWIQFSLRNQISIKKSHLRNKVLTRFAPCKTTSCSLFVLVLKGMTLLQTFSLKIRVWNDIFRKESDSEASVLLHNEILKWKRSKMSGFVLKNFRSGRFYNKKLFEYSYSGEKKIPETQFLSSIYIEESDFDKNITSKT